MPNVKHLDTESQAKAFVAWLLSSEDHDVNIIAARMHVQAHVDKHWPNIDAIRTNVCHYGPKCSREQFDAALATFDALGDASLSMNKATH